MTYNQVANLLWKIRSRETNNSKDGKPTKTVSFNYVHFQWFTCLLSTNNFWKWSCFGRIEIYDFSFLKYLASAEFKFTNLFFQTILLQQNVRFELELYHLSFLLFILFRRNCSDYHSNGKFLTDTFNQIEPKLDVSSHEGHA